MVSENIQLPETLKLEQDGSTKDQIKKAARVPGLQAGKEPERLIYKYMLSSLRKQDPEDCTRG